MGILSDFFLATSSDLSRVFRGWQLPPLPLPRAVVVQVVNPFTRQPVQITTRRDSARMPEPSPLAAPSPDIRSLPNVQCKGLLPDKLAVVFSTVAQISIEDALDLILCGDLAGPPDTEITVFLLPEAFMSALASASPQDLVRAAAAVIADDECSHPDDTAGLTEILSEVQTLAVHGQTNGARLFVWIAP